MRQQFEFRLDSKKFWIFWSVVLHGLLNAVMLYWIGLGLMPYYSLLPLAIVSVLCIRKSSQCESVHYLRYVNQQWWLKQTDHWLPIANVRRKTLLFGWQFIELRSPGAMYKGRMIIIPFSIKHLPAATVSPLFLLLSR